MPIYILTEQMSEKNQMPRAGFEPTTPRSHGLVINVSFVANYRLTPLWLPR